VHRAAHRAGRVVDVFDDLGVTPIINVAGSNTRLGGALPLPEVVQAMAAASQASVSMERLQAAASQVIASVTGAQAGYVTSGAAALTLGSAACMTGLDIGRMDRLPDSSTMPNEIIIARDQRSGYDHAIRASGARLIEVGMNEVVSGAGVRGVESWEYAAAITDRTAAIAYFARPGARPALEEVVEVARARHVPVLVDAAAQLPPARNLRAFIDRGADLVCFSGGKALRGPQNTGILCGRADLIAAAALQNLDLDEPWDLWEPSPTLIPKRPLAGMPRHGIGRGFKVSKEAIVGLLTALKLFSAERVSQEADRRQALVDSIARGLDGIEHVDVRTDPADGEQAATRVDLEIKSGARVSAGEAARRLQHGSPPIYADLTRLDQDILAINPMNLTEDQVEVVVRRFREVLAGK